MGKNDYSKLLKREDWEAYKRNAELRYKQLLVDKTSLEHSLDLADKEIAKFPDEVDEAVDEALEKAEEQKDAD